MAKDIPIQRYEDKINEIKKEISDARIEFQKGIGEATIKFSDDVSDVKHEMITIKKWIKIAACVSVSIVTADTSFSKHFFSMLFDYMKNL